VRALHRENLSDASYQCRRKTPNSPAVITLVGLLLFRETRCLIHANESPLRIELGFTTLSDLKAPNILFRRRREVGFTE
jgi:hypothetical protein